MGSCGGVGATQTDSAQAVAVLAKILNQQKQDGAAAVQLIESARATQGAPEPGKGQLVDLRA
jgi:hypothetical protein